MHVGSGYGSLELGFEILPRQADRDGLPEQERNETKERKVSSLNFSPRATSASLPLPLPPPSKPLHSLLSIEPPLPQQLRQQRHDPLIGQEHSMLSKQLPPGLEGFELPSELGYTDDSRDELDLVGFEEILVLSLRILDEETDGRRSRVDEGVGKGATKRKNEGREEEGKVSSSFWVSCSRRAPARAPSSLKERESKVNTYILIGFNFFSGLIDLVATTSHTFSSFTMSSVSSF